MSNSCQTGWIQYRSNCYNFNIQSLTWSGCKALCDSLNSSMLCITDSATNSWVANQIGSSTPAWIGLSDSPEQNGNYRWVAGCASTYTNWGNGEPNNLGTESWVGGFVNGQYWYKSNASSGICSCQYSVAPTSSPTEAPSNPTSAPSVKPTATPTVVKSYPPTPLPSTIAPTATAVPTAFPSTIAPTATPVPTAVPSTRSPTINPCAPGWTIFNSDCYKFNVRSSLTWTECRTQCSNLGASMLCITDSTTNSWVANQIGSKGWIGLSDLPEQNGNYRWVAGCASRYTNWGSGEPNNLGTESCALADGQYWYNYSPTITFSNGVCSCQYSVAPTSSPTEAPSNPSSAPSVKPTATPTIVKSYPPTLVPTNTPTQPTVVPTTTPPTYDYDDSSGSSSDSTGSTVGIIFAVICFCLCAGGAAKKRELVLVGYAPVYAERDV